MRGAAAALLCGLLALASPAAAAVFNPKLTTLPNGLQVVVIENARAPIVTHMLWVKAGAADDPPGRSGLAHYLEHLMFKSTATRPAGSYSKAIAAVGGTENAFTSADYTGYFATVAKEHLGLVMELEADRFAAIRFDAEEVKPELAVVLDEKRQRVDSEPYAVFSQQLAAALHPSHPYGRPIIGWEEEIARLTAADARDFHAAWYRPGNVILIVSGDVKAQEVFALAQKYYGGWKGEAVPPRRRAANSPFIGRVRIDAEEPRIRETLLQISWRVPSVRLDRNAAYAFQVLEDMLAGSEAAYLPRTLVQEKKLASSVSLDYGADAYDESTLSITVVPRQGVAPDTLLKALHAAIGDYAKYPVDAAALAESKKSLQRQAILAQDSVSGPAYSFGASLATGQTIEDVEQWPETIAAVTPEQIKQALEMLLLRPSVTGVIVPAPRPEAAK